VVLAIKITATVLWSAAIGVTAAGMYASGHEHVPGWDWADEAFEVGAWFWLTAALLSIGLLLRRMWWRRSP
jgi:hypothetical protein